MALPSHTTRTVRTASVSSDSSDSPVLSPGHFCMNGAPILHAVRVAAAPQAVHFVNGGVDGKLLQGNLRYLVPVHRPEPYLVINQAPLCVHQVPNHHQQPLSTEPTNVNGPALKPLSPPKIPEPPEDVVDRPGHSSGEVVELKPLAQLDTRLFGVLLAEVYCKNCNIYRYISENVSKISGRKHLLEPTIDYKVEEEEIEAQIPKGLSELTKQQIRYLLQTRMTADKTMHLLLTTFTSLKKGLGHLQEDLKRLESEKAGLEMDLTLKANQAQQYDKLLEAVRENNRVLQNSLKETRSIQLNLENQVVSIQSIVSSKDFRLKELEGRNKALEHENEVLRKKLEGQGSNDQIEELSRYYKKLVSSLQEEKDKELKNLQSQLVKIQTEYTTMRSYNESLQLQIREHESVSRQQKEEINKLRIQISQNITQTVITKPNYYPILALLNNEFQDRNIVVERRGRMIKEEIIIERNAALIKK